MNMPIKLNEDLRINDYDRLQYSIERRSVNKAGEDVWTPIDYVQSVKSLATIARRRMGDYEARLARADVDKAFDAIGLDELIKSLPAKIPGEAK